MFSDNCIWLIHEYKDVYSGLQYNGKVAVDFSSTASFVLAFIKLLSCKGPRDYNLFNLYFLRLGLQVNGIINQHDSFFLLLAGCIDLYSSVSQMLAFVIEKEQQWCKVLSGKATVLLSNCSLDSSILLPWGMAQK